MSSAVISAGDEEFGMRAIRLLTESSIGWGARRLLFWQLHSNEPAGKYEGRPENDDVKGFYLAKPNGDRSRAWNYFSTVLKDG